MWRQTRDRNANGRPKHRLRSHAATAWQQNVVISAPGGYLPTGTVIRPNPDTSAGIARVEQAAVPIPGAPAVSGYTTDKVWVFDVYSSQLRVQQSHAHWIRLPGSSASLEVQLHDLLSASLTPLTRQYRANHLRQITSQASLFLSSFHTNALWHIDVENLPSGVGDVLAGLTERSRRPDIGFRFLRFRFPYVSFEWFVQTPYFTVASCTTEKSVEVEILWKAWSTGGSASGLVAYGSITDTIRKEIYYVPGRNYEPPQWVPLLVITNRHFKVTRVFQPELMTPVPYPQHMPPNPKPDDILVFSTSSTVIQFLRSSHGRMGFLVAVSALFASLQPIVSNFSDAGGWIFAGIGVLSAVLTVFGLLLGRLLAWSESQAAKTRQV